jgi:effector-binding domain-containing protein/carbon monoxide dehydrogenase subunit G
MRWLVRLSLVLAVVVVLLVAIGFFLPDHTRVERAITIARPPAQVFAVLNGFRRFNDWSPWFELDPDASYRYSGPAFGVGAKASWSGNKSVGSGSQEIVESKPYESIRTALDFGDMGKATASFRLAPAGGGTAVTWALDVDANGRLIGRYFNLLMDSMVGKDYEKGLAKLKALLESLPAADLAGVQGEEVQRPAQKIYFVSLSTGQDPEAIKTAIGEAYGHIGAFLKDHGIAMQGAPMTITTSYDADAWKFDAAIPVDRNDVAASGEVQAGSSYAGRAVAFVHTGPYTRLGETITKAYAWLATEGYQPKDRLIEEYLNDPGEVPPERLQTRIVIPVQ